MNILLAENDVRLGELVVHTLKKKSGYQVDWVQEGGDGTDVCRRLRKDGYSGAILMLTAKDTVDDRVEGLDAGGRC